MTYIPFSGHFKLEDSYSNSKWYSLILANTVWPSYFPVWQGSIFSFLVRGILEFSSLYSCRHGWKTSSRLLSVFPIQSLLQVIHRLSTCFWVLLPWQTALQSTTPLRVLESSYLLPCPLILRNLWLHDTQKGRTTLFQPLIYFFPARSHRPF